MQFIEEYTNQTKSTAISLLGNGGVFVRLFQNQPFLQKFAEILTAANKSCYSKENLFPLPCILLCLANLDKGCFTHEKTS